MPRTNDRVTRDARAVAAKRRAEARASRTNEQQIALLDERPGASARERKRLTKAAKK